MASGVRCVTILSLVQKQTSSVASLASQTLSDMEQLAALELGKVMTDYG